MAAKPVVQPTCADIIAQSRAKFVTSGLRGLVEDLDDATAIAHVLAFLGHLKNDHGLQFGGDVWVGMDLRPSSPAIATACLRAITHAGFNPRFCGVLPTPTLAYTALLNAAPCIMITGSHIPFDRNGIKFYRATGEMLKQDEAPVLTSTIPFPTDLVQNNLAGNAPDSMEDLLPKPELTCENNWLNRYRNAFEGVLDGLTIGHYQHSAAGRDLLTTLLQQLGARVVPLGRSEQFIPIDTEAVSASDDEQARQWAQEVTFDAIISTDGDGDRPLLGDEHGQYLRGDALGILAAHALNADTVVTPVSSTTAVEKSGWFSSVMRTKIGSPEVIGAMDQAAQSSRNRVVGFEANGGFLTASPLLSPWNKHPLAPLPTRDSVLPVLAVITLAKLRGVPLSLLTPLLPGRATASDRIENIPTKKSHALIAHLKSDKTSATTLVQDGSAPQAIDETDGLRITFVDGDIVHVRPSGNAPELRVYTESHGIDAANRLLKHSKSIVAELIAGL